MSRRLVLLGVLTVTAAVVAVAALPAPGPPEYVSAEGHFRARFGGEPEVTANAGARSTTYSFERPTGALTVTVVELPIPDDDPPDNASFYLDRARDDMIRAAGGERVSSAPATIAGRYPGCAFEARFGRPRPGLMRVRLYLVGRRLYQVMAIGAGEFAAGPAATAFLNSFVLSD